MLFLSFKHKKNILLMFFLIVIFLVGLISYQRNSLTILADAKTLESDGIKIPIIMYHSIMKNKKSLGKFVISQDEFESDLKFLKDNNYNTIVMQDVLDYVYNNKTLPENPIMLTFDDGYYNNYLYAYPLLKHYEMKIILSPIGVEIDRYSEIDNHVPSYAHVTWNNLKEMQESGLVEIQNHSYDMHKMNKKRHGTKKNKDESFEDYKNVFSKDLSLMQEKFKNNIGVVPTTFVYPFGAMSNCSDKIIKELGFKASFSCEGKINFINKNPENLYRLCRIIRPSGIESEKFFKKVMSSNTKCHK